MDRFYIITNSDKDSNLAITGKITEYLKAHGRSCEVQQAERKHEGAYHYTDKMFAVFLLRVKPASQRAKPGCMKKTNMAANSIHTVSNEIPKSCTLIIFLLFSV